MKGVMTKMLMYSVNVFCYFSTVFLFFLFMYAFLSANKKRGNKYHTHIVEKSKYPKRSSPNESMKTGETVITKLVRN